MYMRGFLSEQARLGAPLNSRYPHLRPDSVRDAIQKGLL
jgi:hypothetical protein